ncbi:NAD(P)-dependent oxidoreductase [Desulfurococcus amylolyticus]|uniref:NAD(P)-dependent oxidoreductase n=1 Tax=Desulfurococcus amylolyticus TaxID=94694 RepID=UPI0023F34F60|nr:NAD(P)-binding domain-containing protein [Desulfurococcus amylolyticus]
MVYRILVAGAGLMGSSLVRCLVSRGVEVFVYNRNVEKARSLCSTVKCRVIEDLDLMDNVDASVIFLFDDQAVMDFVYTLIEKNLLSRTGILMNSSTISPETSLMLYRMVRDHGGIYIEAPVYGSTDEASACNLVTMLAGDSGIEGKAREIALLYSSKIYWVGGIPKAMALKLALNNIGLIMPAVLAESLALLDSYDVGQELFSEIAGNLWFGNMVRRYLARINIPVSTPRFTISGAAKDYRVISYTLMLKGYTPLLSQAASNFYSLAARDVPGEDYPRAALYYRRKT